MICLRAVRAILDGRLDEAERLAGEALALGGAAPRRVPRRTSSATPSCSRSAGPRAVSASCGRRVDSHGDRFPWIPRWRDALVGRRSSATTRRPRAELERHAARDFADLPRDGLWILHVCALAEACALVGDERRGRAALRAAAPLRGAQRRHLHAAAVRAGRAAPRDARRAARAPGEAERHFATALRRCELLGAARAAGARAARARADAAHRRRRPAAAMLDEAARLCDELGMPGIRARVAALSQPAPTADARSGARASLGDRLRREHVPAEDVKGLRYLAVLPRLAVARCTRSSSRRGRGRAGQRAPRPRAALGGLRCAGPARRAGQVRVPAPPGGARREPRGGARLERPRAGRAGSRRRSTRSPTSSRAPRASGGRDRRASLARPSAPVSASRRRSGRRSGRSSASTPRSGRTSPRRVHTGRLLLLRPAGRGAARLARLSHNCSARLHAFQA